LGYILLKIIVNCKYVSNRINGQDRVVMFLLCLKAISLLGVTMHACEQPRATLWIDVGTVIDNHPNWW